LSGLYQLTALALPHANLTCDTLPSLQALGALRQLELQGNSFGTLLNSTFAALKSLTCVLHFVWYHPLAAWSQPDARGD
jgi:hypothetical protein